MRMFSVKHRVLLIVISIAANIEMVEENGQVEVRSVLIGCEPNNGESDSFDSEAMRFEREELFKHSVLKDCRKKLAVTVKSVSDPDNSGDEYIPIEHVFQGPKKRVRLLNPYVLRLKREPPLQAYKIRKVDTVSGKLIVIDKGTEPRIKRYSNSIELNSLNRKENIEPYKTLIETHEIKSKNCFINNGTSSERMNVDLWLNNRMKRQENIGNLDPFTKILDNIKTAIDTYEDPDASNDGLEQAETNILDGAVFDEGNIAIISSTSNGWKPSNDESKTSTPPYYQKNLNNVKELDFNENSNKNIEVRVNENIENRGKFYDMYEIGNADLWYTIQVQLFEKKALTDGKTVWSDLTDGTPARVGSLNREWTGPHMSVRFRSSEWIPREEFTLPSTTMCLLAPTKTDASAAESKTNKYIVVPKEDVVESNAQNPQDTTKGDDYFPNLEEHSTKAEQTIREVVIRTSRALVSDSNDRMNIEHKAGEPFLTLVHRRPYHFQVDLEARADGNQLVYVGSSGRLMTLVADSSRQTRTVLTVQATNTGLAAARFRVIARYCNPELPDITEKVDGDSDGYILLPPRHTRSIILDLPYELPVESARCTVDLINGAGQSVAVRDVAIKKGDRCFCVWHCECVCLGDDPKLLCRDMAESQQIAAGLTLSERTRNIRSVCYQDVLSLNICLTSFGAFILLLFCGLLKASLGLVIDCIGSWGLSHLVQMPRKIEHYYEPCLWNNPVVYDEEGWPVHPTTLLRTVRLISVPMEFVLNVIFFITVPCILFYEAIKQAYSHCIKTNKEEEFTTTTTANVDGPNDMQGAHRRARKKSRRPTLQRWMTPQAADLSANIWKKGIARSSIISDMRPLLREQFISGGSGPAQDSCGDSELDDTEYVLMQMQKSRESLAKSQRKLNSSTPVTTKKQ